MHHKKRRPKAARAGCKLCYPSKQSHYKRQDRTRQTRFWIEYERRAADGGWTDGGASRVMRGHVGAW